MNKKLLTTLFLFSTILSGCDLNLTLQKDDNDTNKSYEAGNTINPNYKFSIVKKDYEILINDPYKVCVKPEYTVNPKNTQVFWESDDKRLLIKNDIDNETLNGLICINKEKLVGADYIEYGAHTYSQKVHGFIQDNRYNKIKDSINIKITNNINNGNEVTPPTTTGNPTDNPFDIAEIFKDNDETKTKNNNKSRIIVDEGPYVIDLNNPRTDDRGVCTPIYVKRTGPDIKIIWTYDQNIKVNGEVPFDNGFRTHPSYTDICLDETIATENYNILKERTYYFVAMLANDKGDPIFGAKENTDLSNTVIVKVIKHTKEDGNKEPGNPGTEEKNPDETGKDTTNPEVPKPEETGDKYTTKELNNGNNTIQETFSNNKTLNTILYTLGDKLQSRNQYTTALTLQELQRQINAKVSNNYRESKYYHNLTFSPVDNEQSMKDKHFMERYRVKNRLKQQEDFLAKNSKPIGTKATNNYQTNYKVAHPGIIADENNIKVKSRKCTPNETEQFYISGDSNQLINTTCVAESNHAYYYVDKRLTIDTRIMEQIKTAFDEGRNKIVEIYGPEADVDKNGKVIFVITNFNTPNLLGYFTNIDKYSNQIRIIDGSGNSIKNLSNQGDILYVNARYITNDPVELDHIQGTFLHEFQHMTHFDNKHIHNDIGVNLDTWIDEGLSILAEYLTGHAEPHAPYLQGLFREKQGKAMNLWVSTGSSYGLSLVFMRYVQERYGLDFIKKLYSSRKHGIDAIEEALGVDFNTLYKDFVTMLMVTGRGITNDSRYNIPAFNHKTGSAEYKKNGFNIADTIDIIYNKPIRINDNAGRVLGYTFGPNEPHATTQSSKQYTLEPYSFVITRWMDPKYNQNTFTYSSQQPTNIFMHGNNNIHGFYEVMETKNICTDLKPLFDPFISGINCY